MFRFDVEGCKFEIVVSDHAGLRMKQRGVERYAAYGSIVAMGERLLEMCNSAEFCIIDKELDISIVCKLLYEKDRKGLPVMEINIITVMDSSSFYVKEGTQVYQLAA